MPGRKLCHFGARRRGRTSSSPPPPLLVPLAALGFAAGARAAGAAAGAVRSLSAGEYTQPPRPVLVSASEACAAKGAISRIRQWANGRIVDIRKGGSVFDSSPIQGRDWNPARQASDGAFPHTFADHLMEAAVDDRQLLAKLGAGRLSGDALAHELGVTRAAIWKRIQGLRAAGVEVDGRAGEGYGLTRPMDLLDADAIRTRLPKDAQALVRDLQVAWTVDSTNAELLRCSAPEQGVRVLLAERQTGGRGRRGRTWASPLAAHVYLSVLRLFSGGLVRLSGLSLVAGIAVAEALHDLGYVQARLKWPNDLMVDGRKLVGLLAEGGGEYAGPARAVIGIGINVHMPAAFAEQITQPWIDLDTLAGAPVDRNAVVAAVLARLLPALETFDAEGLAPFLPRYAELDLLRGQTVRVEQGGQWREGTALGLADDGALRVRIDGVEQHVHAGEVSVRAQ